MKHWEVFQDSHIARIQDGPEHQDTAACKMVKDIGILMTSLDQIKGEFGAMRTQVTLLRDGVRFTCCAPQKTIC
jgi:predicted RNA-binding protein associated with RNAse of E/G family